MTVAECYQYAQSRLNKLGSNFSENLPKYQFVQAFNAMQILWVESRFKVDETNIVRTDYFKMSSGNLLLSGKKLSVL